MPIPFDISPQAPEEIASALSKLLGFIYYIAWAIAIAMLFWGIVDYVRGDSPEKAIHSIQNSIVGIILLAFIFVVLNYLV